MIDLTQVDQINRRAVALQPDDKLGPALIEIDEATVETYIARTEDNDHNAVVVINLNPREVTAGSPLVSDGGLLFQLLIAGREVAGGRISLTTGDVVTVVAA